MKTHFESKNSAKVKPQKTLKKLFYKITKNKYLQSPNMRRGVI